MSRSDYALEVNEISKSFPGVKALDHVSLKVRPGTVHTLMGENGAGKSTLMKCIYGIYLPDDGKILVNGEEVKITRPRDAMDLGISMIPQELHPIQSQNVMENVFLGRIPYRKVAGIQWVDENKLYNETREVFEKMGLDIDPRVNVGTLSTSYCQLIEIARAVTFGANTIIMDEPTSALTDSETDILFRIIKQLKEANVSVIYISHKIDEILEISDEVTILRDGQYIGSWSSSELTSDLIINRMVGRKMGNRFPDKSHKPSEKVYLEVEHLTSPNPHSFKDVSFNVKKGEIFGIGGLVGAQRSELMEAIFGLRTIESGKIRIDGQEVKNKKPIDAISHGFALLTEDRRQSGIIGTLSVTENIMVVDGNIHSDKYRINNTPFLNDQKRNNEAKKYVDRLEIKTVSVKTLIDKLSGGTQQKVLLARWLLVDPDILILDEPTKGIDVGAKYEIYELMEEMAAQGKCIIMISSEMPELMGMSDRIMVMCEGYLSGFIDGENVTDEEIMCLASSYQ